MRGIPAYGPALEQVPHRLAQARNVARSARRTGRPPPFGNIAAAFSRVSLSTLVSHSLSGMDTTDKTCKAPRLHNAITKRPRQRFPMACPFPRTSPFPRASGNPLAGGRLPRTSPFPLAGGRLGWGAMRPWP